jgi:hypothetical protein
MSLKIKEPGRDLVNSRLQRIAATGGSHQFWIVCFEVMCSKRESFSEGEEWTPNLPFHGTLAEEMCLKSRYERVWIELF